jgi:hypothetical protein
MLDVALKKLPFLLILELSVRDAEGSNGLSDAMLTDLVNRLVIDWDARLTRRPIWDAWLPSPSVPTTEPARGGRSFAG